MNIMCCESKKKKNLMHPVFLSLADFFSSNFANVNAIFVLKLMDSHSRMPIMSVFFIAAE